MTPPGSHGKSAVPDLSRYGVALLTGGGDKPYALGLAFALLRAGCSFEFVGSDELDVPGLREQPAARFHNLRGDQNPAAPLLRKALRVVCYYARLLRFAATTEARIFHLLWNNKFEILDRTLLMVYYRLLGKRVVMTVHNVNKAARDGSDSAPNRWTLRFQYHLCDHLFVHTAKMKEELLEQFGIPPRRVTVIPFGVNDTVPDTALGRSEAKRGLGLATSEKAILFFGNIAPYKGLDYLVEAMVLLARRQPGYRLVIAGRPKGCEDYWTNVQERIQATGLERATVQRIEYVPDEDTEIYFKAADVLVLPYTRIFQSGVLFLAYNFGLPVVATDVGSLREDIVEGMTGLLCRPLDAADLARALEEYFAGELYTHLEQRRPVIRRWALEKYSWARVSTITADVYREVGSGGQN